MGVTRLQEAIGAALLRTNLLGAPALRISGRYAIEALLGRGASGVVVAAHDTRLDRSVALKLSLAEPGDDLSEARALAKLDHPNIVRVYDAELVRIELGGATWNLRVLVMQRVDAVSLRSWLQAADHSPDDILDVCRAAGRGLAAAHAQRVIHRDFKPDNVLVRTDGVAQVVDFGFAIAANSTRSANEGRSTDVAGTDPYLAPEARKGIASARGDQFAFGISVSEALTGELRSPSFWRPGGVPRHVWRALRRATRAQPDRRFGSMDELLARLDRPRTGRLMMLAAALVFGAVAALMWTRELPVPLLRAHFIVDNPLGDGGAELHDAAGTRRAVDASNDVVGSDVYPDCLVLPEGSRRIRSRSPSDRLYGCYVFTLGSDEDGCAMVTSVMKDGSGSAPTCWNGDARTASSVRSARRGGELTVDANIGGRAYTFELRANGGLLEGDFRWVYQRRSDRGSLIEVH